ncbi:transposase [Lactococcus petauri]|uniref:transposase n=1 Tax=Lactococcus petauri TaxID=1940789 RepID=UPI0035D9056C
MVLLRSLKIKLRNRKTFPNFSKRRKVIERVFSFLKNLGAERCKSRSSYGFQVKLEMTLLTYSLMLKSAKIVNSKTLRYSTGYQVMAE